MKRTIYNLGRSAVLALVLTVVCGSFSEAMAQTFRTMQLPKLSLTGEASGYNADYYPDGRIRIPQSNGSPRTFIVPVFIENTWDPEIGINIIDQRPGANGDPILRVAPEEIYSFEFSIFYDSSLVRFNDVITTAQIHNKIEGDDVEDWIDPILADWDVASYTTPSRDYLTSLFENPSATDVGKGWKATVTGTSSQSMPITFGNEILCYLEFEAVPDVTRPGTNALLKAPIYIANDTVKYNGLNIITNHPFEKYQALATSVGSGALGQNEEFNDEFLGGIRQTPRFYLMNRPNNPINQNYLATNGIDNSGLNIQSEPTAPGMMYIEFMDELPKLLLTSDRGGSDNIVPVPNSTPRDEAERFELSDPITTDASQQQPLTGERLLRVSNSVNNTRLRYLEIETDQEWLLIEPTTSGQNSKTDGIYTESDRKIFVNYIDAGLLGGSISTDPLNNGTQDDGDLFINIIADPSRLNNRLDDPDADPNDPEKAGKYVGHITFRSPDTEIAPIELEITFIYFRIPQEACERAQNVPRGIKLNVRNSNGQNGERTTMHFGTGNRATRGVDELFGEFAYQSAPTGFYSRFFPVDENGQPVMGVADNGFGDFNPNTEDVKPGGSRESSSRDIRSSNAAQKSIIYYVKFDADGDQNYPVVVDWDVRDFRICDDENGDPQVGDLFLRDTENGRLFPSINMQNGTIIDANRRSYTFQDPEITEFLIEYTLPNVIEFVDEEGLPIIKEGWNLLSLPVNPTNKNYGIVYPEATSNAWTYIAKAYSDVRLDEQMEVGRGYFIKYGTDIDVTFAGTSINTINDNNFPVRVYGGDNNATGSWNLIGGVSRTAPIEAITFGEYNGRQADPDYTLRYGVWRYVPARGYEEVAEIRPGRGYWIKVDEDSYYELCTSGDASCKQSDVIAPFAEKEAMRNSAVSINIADNSGKVGNVYFSNHKNNNGLSFNLPPVPSTDVFDVRFNSGKQLTNEIEDLISISGASYPVAISMDNADAEYQLYSAVTGQELGRIRAGSNDVVTIHNENVNLVAMRRVASAGIQDASGAVVTVFPNPTASTLNVNYVVNETSNVTIELVNTVGNVMISDSFSADNNGVRELDVNNLANGTYLVRITNADNTVVAPVTIAK